MKKLNYVAETAVFALLFFGIMLFPLIVTALISLLVFLTALIFSPNAAIAFDNVAVAIIIIMVIGFVLNVLWFFFMYAIGKAYK